MRKLILLAAAAAIAMPTAAFAQRPHHHGDRHRDRVELRHDRRDVRRDRRELRRDRHERRYDRHYRRHVAYVAPYRGWSYRPVTVGFRLRPVFYSPRYYVTDYGYYGLRVPRPWERWIRYGNDLLLVNLRTGRVLSVIHYRYW